MSGFRIEGNTSGNVVEVDTNHQLNTTTTTTANLAGFTTLGSEIDKGTVTGSRFVNEIYSSNDYRLTVGMCTPLFDYQFISAAQDTNFWYYKFTTMTATSPGGFLLLNAILTATIGTGVYMQTWRYFKLLAGGELFVDMGINITAAPIENQVAEFGLFLGTVTTVPADGAYYRLSSAGLIGIVNNAGTETPTGVIPVTLVPGTNYQLGINITQESVEFWIDEVIGAKIHVPSGNGNPFASLALPICLQQRNSGAISGSPQMQLKCASVHVEQDDLALGAPYSHIQAAAGMQYQGQPGGTQGPDNYYTASVAPVVFAWVAAATGAMAGLGGIAVCNPTTAAATDGIIFSYQNPVGSITQTPRTLVITGVQAQSAVSTVLANTSALALAYSIGFGHTAATLATTTSTTFATATTKAPRIIPIGFETYAINAAVGVIGSAGITLDLTQSPIVVNPGEYVALVVRNVGGVTTSGAITVVCTMKHYYI